MRRCARVDGNQAELLVALRQFGASVQHLHSLGRGCPDLLVGYHGVNLLIEVKDGTLAPSRRRLTPDEAAWHQNWRGQVAIVSSTSEALTAIEQLNGATYAQEN